MDATLEGITDKAIKEFFADFDDHHWYATYLWQDSQAPTYFHQLAGSAGRVAPYGTHAFLFHQQPFSEINGDVIYLEISADTGDMTSIANVTIASHTHNGVHFATISDTGKPYLINGITADAYPSAYLPSTPLAQWFHKREEANMLAQAGLEGFSIMYGWMNNIDFLNNLLSLYTTEERENLIPLIKTLLPEAYQTLDPFRFTFQD